MVSNNRRITGHVRGEARQKASYAIGKFRGAVSGDIGPSLRFVSTKNVPLSASQPIGRAYCHIERRSVFARHQQHTVGEISERGRVEKNRRAQHNASETIGGRRRERSEVTGDHSRDMRPLEAEMIEHADKTCRR